MKTQIPNYFKMGERKVRPDAINFPVGANLAFARLLGLLILCLFASPAFAQQKNLPDSLWETTPIDDTVLSIAYGDVNNDFVNELLYATPNKLVVLSDSSGNLMPTA